MASNRKSVGENVKSFVSQTLGHIFCTQDAISESFHLLLRPFIFNANVFATVKIVHRHISGSKGSVCPQGRRVGVRRGVKLSLSTVKWENQLSGPHGNIQ